MGDEDLRRRLGRLDRKRRRRTLKDDSEPAFPRSGLPPGEEIDTPVGPTFLIQSQYPMDYLHGRNRLSDILEYDTLIAAEVARQPNLGETSIERLVFIDTETTGRDSSRDRVVEVGCVLWDKGAVVAQHSWLIHPGCPIPREATQVHGIRDEDVSKRPSFAEIVTELLSVLSGFVPLAYNAEFDRAFLTSEFERARVDPSIAPPAVRRNVEWIDPLVWAREIQKHEKGKALSDVCARLKIDLERAHRATDDAEAALRVMHSFLGELRVPKAYGAFIQEQRRLARAFADERRRWRRGNRGWSGAARHHRSRGSDLGHLGPHLLRLADATRVGALATDALADAGRGPAVATPTGSSPHPRGGGDRPRRGLSGLLPQAGDGALSGACGDAACHSL